VNANIEIKARVNDPEELARRAKDLSGGDPEILRQEDVFFETPRGRLKLRTITGAQSELIAYSRPDRDGPTTSSYVVTQVVDPRGVREALSSTLGESGVVRKTRYLSLVGRTRVHVDDVEGLGWFMELEVVLRHGEDPTVGEGEARRLMTALGVVDDDLVDCSYVDLLKENR
jgi:predicted adenylyl cyclase CyaB